MHPGAGARAHAMRCSTPGAEKFRPHATLRARLALMSRRRDHARSRRCRSPAGPGAAGPGSAQRATIRSISARLLLEQAPVRGPGVERDLLGRGRAGDHRGDRRAGQEPRERELEDRAAARRGERHQRLDHGEVSVRKQVDEAAGGLDPAALGRRTVAAVPAGEETAGVKGAQYSLELRGHNTRWS